MDGKLKIKKKVYKTEESLTIHYSKALYVYFGISVSSKYYLKNLNRPSYTTGTFSIYKKKLFPQLFMYALYLTISMFNIYQDRNIGDISTALIVTVWK